MLIFQVKDMVKDVFLIKRRKEEEDEEEEGARCKSYRVSRLL